MCGSGVKIGMATTVVLLRPILLVLTVGLTACTVEVAGAALPGTVACHAVAAARLSTAAATLGSAWSSPSNDIFTKERGSRFLYFSSH